jgi:hypothetical protein
MNLKIKMARRLLLKQNSLNGYANPSSDYSHIGYQDSTLSEKITGTTSPIFKDTTPNFSQVLTNGNLVDGKSIDFTGATASISVYKQVFTDEMIELSTTDSKESYVLQDTETNSPDDPVVGYQSNWSRFSMFGIEYGAIESVKYLALGETIGDLNYLKVASEFDRISITGIEVFALEVKVGYDVPSSGIIDNFYRISMLGVETFLISQSFDSDTNTLAKPIISIKAPTFSNNTEAISAGLTTSNIYIEASTGAIKMII